MFVAIGTPRAAFWIAALVVMVANAGCAWVEVSPQGSTSSNVSTSLPKSSLNTARFQPKPPATAPKARQVKGSEVQVVPGDTVYALSRQYGVPVSSIIEANALQPPYYLHVGQWIELPRDRRHVVSSGETLYGVSRQYAVDPRDLARANNLAPPYGLQEGQRLRIPVRETSPNEPEIQREVLPPPQPTADAVAGQSAKPTPVVATAPLPPAAVSPPPPITSSGFMWPLRGEVISRFGSKTKGLRNDGMNIAAEKGTPIRASENGVVAYAGNELRGFGNMILIKHAGGWVTAYAHTEVLLVGRGDTVRKGQIIARVGTSGGVSRPQLHFEIRKGKTAVDPAKHLGKDSA